MISLWFRKRNIVGKLGPLGNTLAELIVRWGGGVGATSFPQNIIVCHIQFVL